MSLVYVLCCRSAQLRSTSIATLAATLHTRLPTAPYGAASCSSSSFGAGHAADRQAGTENSPSAKFAAVRKESGEHQSTMRMHHHIPLRVCTIAGTSTRIRVTNHAPYNIIARDGLPRGYG